MASLNYYQDKWIFRWVRNQKLYQLLEPCHAPYAFKHRYWTGLLLFAHIVLYIRSAVNQAEMQVAIDLMVVIMIVSCLLFLKGNFRKVYKNTLLTILETIIYMNIIILCTIKFYNYYCAFSRQRKLWVYKQEILTYIPVSIIYSFSVISCHLFYEIISKTNMWKVLTACFKKREQGKLMKSLPLLHKLKVAKIYRYLKLLQV